MVKVVEPPKESCANCSYFVVQKERNGFITGYCNEGPMQIPKGDNCAMSFACGRYRKGVPKSTVVKSEV